MERERKTYCTTDGKRKGDIQWMERDRETYSGCIEWMRLTVDGEREGGRQRTYREREADQWWIERGRQTKYGQEEGGREEWIGTGRQIKDG